MSEMASDFRETVQEMAKEYIAKTGCYGSRILLRMLMA
jgi:hypothetical protein